MPPVTMVKSSHLQMKTATNDADQTSVIAKMAREPLNTKEIASYERSFN